MDTSHECALTMFGDPMNLKISHAETSIVFDFEEPTPLHMLVVSNSNEEVQWEIEPKDAGPGDGMPVTPTSPPVLDSSFVAVQVPGGVVRSLSKAIEADRTRYPQVRRVVYGQLPPGFREVVEAKALTPGEKYCVLVFGGGLDSASDFFTP